MAKNEDFYNVKIFKLSRIKFEELYADALNYLKLAYKNVKQYFNSSSPFAQLLQVILHLGREIFYYIEDSITGMNIRTAYRPDQIRGLATLTGHRPSRPISARGAIKISYYNTGANEYEGQVCYMPNKLAVFNKLNGYQYVVLFSADRARITMKASNYIEASIIQGKIKYQSGTGTGTALQSFNFGERNFSDIDQLFVNVYVNGERWDIVDSILDLGFQQKAAVVKSGMLGGVDVFFGNEDMGAIPPNGSTITIEYVVSDGFTGNMPKEIINSDAYWEFVDKGYLSDGTTIDLNNYFKISSTSDIIFGTDGEDIVLTQQIAPYSSRSMVLANETNYKYFFKRMNMFSIIEVMSGTNTFSDVQALHNYQIAYSKYEQLSKSYINAVSLYGENSEQVEKLYKEMNDALDTVKETQYKLNESELDDNTIYLMLVPDIKKRISSASNYFTCDPDAFLLSEDEQASLLNLIEVSGQRVITVENKIVQPKTPRFAINASIKMWDTYKFEDVYNACLNAISDYFINLDRRDMIPLSDIIRILEGISGIDSVKVSFDPDKENEQIYGKTGFYGIDEFGDVVLTRDLQDVTGSSYTVRDIYPLFRGDFVSTSEISYVDDQQINNLSGFNLTLTGYSSNRQLNMETAKALY